MRPIIKKIIMLFLICSLFTLACGEGQKTKEHSLEVKEFSVKTAIQITESWHFSAPVFCKPEEKILLCVYGATHNPAFRTAVAERVKEAANYMAERGWSEYAYSSNLSFLSRDAVLCFISVSGGSYIDGSIRLTVQANPSSSKSRFKQIDLPQDIAKTDFLPQVEEALTNVISQAREAMIRESSELEIFMKQDKGDHLIEMLKMAIKAMATKL